MFTEEPSRAYNRLKRMALQFIPDSDFERIEKGSVHLIFQKGETILKQGNIPSHIAYLEKGVVKFSYQNELGRNLILTIVAAPKILGGANLFYKDNNLFSIVATEPCTVMMIDTAALMKVLSVNARFSMMLFQYAAEMFKTSIQNFISLAYKQKEARIADIILYLSEHVYEGNSFTMALTRKELAEFAGCSAENVIMTLRRWQNEGILTINKREFTINQPDKLHYISKIG